MLRSGQLGVTDPVWVQFGDWLRRAREKASLSLEQVDELSAAQGQRVTKSYLSRVELGEYLADLDRLQTLGNLYGYTLPDLVAKYESMKMEAEAARRPEDRLKDYGELIARAGKHAHRGEHTEALGLYDRALRVTRRFPDEPDRKLDALMGVGSCLYILGRWSQARSIAEQLIAGGKHNPRILSSGIHLLANTFVAQRKLDIAEALLQGFRSSLGTGPPKARGRAMLTLSSIQRELDRPADAARSARRGLEDFSASDEPISPSEFGQAHYIHGRALASLEKCNLALRELALARELFQKAGALKRVAGAFIGSGEIYFQAQNFVASRRYTTRGVRLARECGAIELLLVGYTQLWSLETRLDNKELASSHRRMARRIQRRVPKGMPFLRGIAETLRAMELSD